MRCTVCGREAMNPEANFCDYCGSSFRQNREEARNQGANTQENGSWSAFETLAQERVELQNRTVVPANGVNEKPVTLWTFLGVFLLIFLPYVGMYAFLGLLLCWSFAPGITGVRKTFARALLIFSAIMMVFMVLCVSVMLESGMFDSILQQMGISF